MRRFIPGFVLGVAYLQTRATLPSFIACATMVVAMVASLVLVRKQQRHARRVPAYVSAVVVHVAGVICGIVWSALLAYLSLSDSLSSALENKDVTLTGIVQSMPEALDNGVRFAFLVEHVDGVHDRVSTVPKNIMLSWYSGFRHAHPSQQQTEQQSTLSSIKPGERWRLLVRLKRVHGNANPMGFDTELRMLERGIRATGYVRADRTHPGKNCRLTAFVWGMHTMVAWSRMQLRLHLQAALADRPYAGIIVALVVGDQQAITPASWDVFRRTGVSHLVAISGLHVTLVAGALANMFGWLWRRSFFTRRQFPLWMPVQKASALAGIVAAGIYVLLAGFGVPAQRAWYMLMVVGLTTWLNRLVPFFSVLMIALFVVLVLDPWAVLSAGFWLSFGAVAIILYASAGRSVCGTTQRNSDQQTSRLQQKLSRLLNNIKQGSRTQYAVTLGLLPLTIAMFGQYSIVSPIANAVAIPVVTLLVAPLSLIGSVLPEPLSTGLLLLAHWVLVCLSAFLAYLSQLSFAVWTTPIPDTWMLIVALAGVLLLLAPKGWPLRWLGSFACLPLLLNTATSPANKTLWLTAFDVGQGMSVLVETAQHRLLYDTGPSLSGDMDAGKRVLLPYMAARGISQLDTMVVSHSDDDHAGGALSVMDGVSVSHVLASLDNTHPIARAAHDYQQCTRGRHWSWEGVDFMFLHPTPDIYHTPKIKPNGRSCVLRITVANKVILLAGDIEAAQEKALLAREYPRDLKADILLVPHHGSGTSSTEAFLKAVKPSIALFQMGYLNHFHHPKPVVWERYGTLGVTRFRSDTDGAVSIRIDENGTITALPYRKTHGRYWYGQ